VIRSGCSAPLRGVVIDRGRRSGRVGDDVVLSEFSDQGMADEDVVDQFLASPIFAAERDAARALSNLLRIRCDESRSRPYRIVDLN
jgi:hypothetical protein